MGGHAGHRPARDRGRARLLARAACVRRCAGRSSCGPCQGHTHVPAVPATGQPGRGIRAVCPGAAPCAAGHDRQPPRLPKPQRPNAPVAGPAGPAARPGHPRSVGLEVLSRAPGRHAGAGRVPAAAAGGRGLFLDLPLLGSTVAPVAGAGLFAGLCGRATGGARPGSLLAAPAWHPGHGTQPAQRGPGQRRPGL
eukprot:XP_015584246.1 uncharacterized protein LOC107262590 [Ricinus communis]